MADIPAAAPKNSSFSPAFFFLSGGRKEALSALYAFCRAVDDAVDEPGGADPRESIRLWRAELDRLYAGEPTLQIAKNLLVPVKNFGLRKEDFLLLIEGVESDIAPRRYKTLAELEWYLARVASAVGMQCARIFGCRHEEQAREYAKWLGYGIQLTNIIRDAAEDSRAGRLYLPLDDLERFGLAENDILNPGRAAALARLLAFEAEKARGFYAKARAALHPADRKCMFPAMIMACVYEGLLGKMEAGGFGVSAERPRLGKAEKIWCIIKAWRNSHVKV
ncbi:MAG: squalene/phytoene synthase family protein [Elusimicrobiales bacterium]|nr:squalene/phytoene synthase family protein [Elusimicrobiales bacterium]